MIDRIHECAIFFIKFRSLIQNQKCFDLFLATKCNNNFFSFDIPSAPNKSQSFLLMHIASISFFFLNNYLLNCRFVGTTNEKMFYQISKLSYILSLSLLFEPVNATKTCCRNTSIWANRFQSVEAFYYFENKYKSNRTIL